jgi:hypothetical protein
MRGPDEFVFPILDAVRTRPKGGHSLAEVVRKAMPEQRDGEIPHHTGGRFFVRALHKLVETNLITLTNRTGDDKGKKLPLHRLYFMLRDKEEEIVVKITPHFYLLQEVLNLAICLR